MQTFLTVAEAAARLGYSLRRVQRACQRMGAARHGKSYLIEESQLAEIDHDIKATWAKGKFVGGERLGKRKKRAKAVQRE